MAMPGSDAGTDRPIGGVYGGLFLGLGILSVFGGSLVFYVYRNKSRMLLQNPN